MPNLGRAVLTSVVAAVLASGGVAAQADSRPDDAERLLDRAARLDVRNATLFVGGYGTALRRDLTGSVTVVAADELATHAMAAPTFTHALQGRAAGVRVVSNSGMPGAGLRVRIRGTNSINATSEPLYVLDGLPLDQESSSSDPKANPLASIDADDIASMQILKDASATAMYGARGANGVVLITTRRGRPGENRMSLESSYGVQQVARRIDVLNARDFMRITNLARANADQPALFTDGQIARAQTFDYPSQMTRTGVLVRNVSPAANERESQTG